MKLHHLFISFSIMLPITACNPVSIPNAQPTTQDKNNHQHIQKSQNENTNNENMKAPKEQQSVRDFYVRQSDFTSLPRELAEHVITMKLIMHNGCLSLNSIDDENRIFTFVLLNDTEILFDDNQKIIGIMDGKSKKKILIGEGFGINSTGGVDPALSKKPIPKECSQTLLVIGGIL